MVQSNPNQPIVKMYAIFARETLEKMQGNEGKLAAQAGHAYLHAWWDAEERTHPDNEEAPCFLGYDYYSDAMVPYKEDNDARKIALVVEKVEELEMLYERYRPYMGATLVEDCAYTIFDSPTITCVGLGPVDDSWFKQNDGFLKRLDLLRHEL